jgi:hypothetical protein
VDTIMHYSLHVISGKKQHVRADYDAVRKQSLHSAKFGSSCEYPGHNARVLGGF